MSALHVELLTKARANVLANKGFGHICFALEDVASGLMEQQASEEIKRHIKHLLGRATTLESWLYNQGYCLPLLAEHANYDFYMSYSRELRARWIDWLIEEWRDAP